MSSLTVPADTTVTISETTSL
ncbi:MAG: hypothetical protein H6Q73_2457, partial [Firmicutes bacterium]|nr:hypothetical protein [Bacillota bacterium]